MKTPITSILVLIALSSPGAAGLDGLSQVDIALHDSFYFAGTQIPPGTYRVEAGDKSLRLTPMRGTAMLIPASATSHDEVVADVEAIVGEYENGCHVLLLRADGSALEAVGTRGEAAPRDLRSTRLAVPQITKATLEQRTVRLADLLQEIVPRVPKLTAAIGELRGLATQPMPPSLTPYEQEAWRGQTRWLGEMAPRLESSLKRHKKSLIGAEKLGVLPTGISEVGLAVAGGMIPGADVIAAALESISGGSLGDASDAGGSMVAEMSKMNMQFLALQNAIQTESRKFQTTSSAIRTRHDSAMNTIRKLGHA